MTAEVDITHQDTHKRIVEALLFATSEPLSIDQIYEYLPENADAGAAISALKDDYAGRGVELVTVGGRWSFKTAADLSEHLTLQRQEQRKLSRAAMETLSIIAYHQPVTRAEIETIRGVSTGRGTLDILIEAAWVKPGRRRDSPGRPLTWVTTQGFLDHFNLESIRDLPGLDELKVSGLLDKSVALDSALTMGDLFEANINENEDE
jgi:segregation and condensation protein B|tara:strand:- start:78771 stop:79388 length:618 start_codon:yes stop_codon:yes gene_type:complete